MSKPIDLDDGIGKRPRGFLRQVVSDAACQEPVRVLAGELLSIRSGIGLLNDGIDLHTRLERSYRFSTQATFPAADRDKIESTISSVVTMALA